MRSDEDIKGEYGTWLRLLRINVIIFSPQVNSRQGER